MDMPLQEARAYLGSSPKAADHDAYWERALALLDTHDPQVEIREEPLQFRSAGCHRLLFTGVGGARISVKLVQPRKAGRHPALLLFHGYTADSGDWMGLLPYAAEGFVVAAMDCRGQAGDSEDTGSYAGYTVRGHLTRGLAGDPDGLLYRQIYLDTVLLTRILRDMDGVDGSRMATMGNSQGGALSIACSALSGCISRTVALHPWLSDFGRCMQLDICRQVWSPYSELSDFFRRSDPLHEREKEYMDKLSYIDVQHLASRIQNPTLMLITQSDNTCPPSTQYAVYNRLTCPKELVEYPDHDHEWPPRMSDLSYTFLKPLLEEAES